jgi:hypothetical protein
MPDIQMNVLFHGLYVFIERANKIEALIPDMGDEHVYRAGEWLGETQLRRGEYTLDNVRGTGGGFDGTKNLIVDGFEKSSSREGVYASIIVPRPNSIVSLRTVTLDEAALTITDPAKVSSRNVSTIQVLNYTIDDPENVTLGDHVFTRSVQQSGDSFVFNLHIIAGPDVGEQPEHTIDGFGRASALLPGVEKLLQLHHSPEIPPVPLQAVPPGCVHAEFIDHSERVLRSAFFGRRIRQALLANPPKPLPSFDEMQGIGGDLKTCTFLISRIAA